MSTVLPVYQCSNCGDWHEAEDDARECCAPSVVCGWRCDACKDAHRLKENAEACCGNQCRECGEWNNDGTVICETCGHDPESDPPTPTMLEAMGQQRLAL